MKKIMGFVVFATMMFSMCVNAQTVTNIKSVKTVPMANQTQTFYVLTDSAELQVSPLVYKIVESAVEDFCVVEVGDVKTVFAKADFANPTQYVFEVAKEPELVNDMSMVTMTNGYTFADPDIAWLAVLKGQHVQVSRYVGLTREITVFETVSRSTALTDIDAAVASAPAKSKIPQLIEGIKAKAKAKKAEVLAMNSVNDAESASNPTGQMVITFGRK